MSISQVTQDHRWLGWREEIQRFIEDEEFPGVYGDATVYRWKCSCGFEFLTDDKAPPEETCEALRAEDRKLMSRF